ncbi:hypothetical protein CONLIGDRAFT_569183 [Coniochaeta ligniaria NRRL 30616]|uniref:Uncharacterized protein n=1 Tax=Coniochaeta ligniaria NRRL 30616 TaxID=1408157 RepID=A0A1J7J2M0_9PEZI|nr:hypothetical protein CONLIGDRAFT_569183 [Coniochaeta ligniaria NRRL 30616]
MERDIRRDRGQWRGCHSFKDIICDGEGGYSPSRDGGLKMGETYFYYYELDGSTETHDPTVPTTSHCPYLPGQTVNTLWVPVEQNSRKRSASLNSMHTADLKTMDPSDKFTTPRPAPSPLGHMAVRHIATAPSSIIRHKRSARSLSPGSSWSFSPRKLFSRKASSTSLRESDTSNVRGARPQSRDGSRSRDISPDSLRRFLSDDTPFVAEPEVNERPALAIPEDIAEENEDDDNFATSATSESLHFTVLSPPPSQHSQSRCTTPMPSAEDSSLAASTGPAVVESTIIGPATRAPPRIPDFAQMELPAPGSETFSFDPTLLTPASPESTASNEIPSFYYSDDEDEDEDDGYQLPSLEGGIGATDSFDTRFGKTLSTYSLPLTSDPADKLAVEEPATSQLGSPALVARNGTDVPVGNTSMLTSPIPNSGLDELVNELGWIADIINGTSA